MFTVSLAGSLFFSVSADAARPRILLYLLLTLAPFAVLGPFIAPVIDKGSGGYRFVILATSFLRSAACASIAFSLDSLLFFPEAFVVLVLGRTYSVAKSSMVARLVDDDRRLVAANSQLARMGTIGGVAGGALGAGLLHFGDRRWHAWPRPPRMPWRCSSAGDCRTRRRPGRRTRCSTRPRSTRPG